MVFSNDRGVGFLRYFQFKQLPNFLLASPILTLAICSIIHYVKSQPKVVYSLGFKASDEGKDSAPVFFSSGRAPESISTDMSEKVSSKMQGITIEHMLTSEAPKETFLSNYLFQDRKPKFETKEANK